MASPAFGALRFLRGWLRSGSSHQDWATKGAQSSWPPHFPGLTVETRTMSGLGPDRARWYAPARAKGPLPGWLLLHGASIQGPDHPALVRFAAALAYAGTAVLIPDIPAWRKLDLDPAPARSIVARSLAYLCEDAQVLPGGAMLAGFSFGCPQVLRLAADLAPTHSIRGVVGFGGYADLAATVRFGLTGQFEWRGRSRHMKPDPYGRWVVAANYLHLAAGYEGAEEVSRGLRRLASLAGAQGVLAWDPVYDQAKTEIMKSLPPEDRDLFRLFAPPADQEPDPERADRIAPKIARAAQETHPLLELPPSLNADTLPSVHLLHGRGDPLIPFSETFALERQLLEGSRGGRVTTTVTRLFAHARESGGIAAHPAEALRLFLALRDLMSQQTRPTITLAERP